MELGGVLVRRVRAAYRRRCAADVVASNGASSTMAAGAAPSDGTRWLRAVRIERDPIGQPQPGQARKETAIAPLGRRDHRVIRRVHGHDEHRSRVERAGCPLQRPAEPPPQVSLELGWLDD